MISLSKLKLIFETGSLSYFLFEFIFFYFVNKLLDYFNF